jgi:D-lyxose ketol-isomerase
MKRSQINAAIGGAIDLLLEYRWSLPPSAHWSAEQFAESGETARYLRDHQMGWDVTDFGSATSPGAA